MLSASNLNPIEFNTNQATTTAVDFRTFNVNSYCINNAVYT